MPISGKVFLVGIVAGVMTGLIGASGVMVVVPGLALLGYTVHQAIGISLAVDMVASLLVAWTYSRHGRVDLRQGIWIAIASIAGAQLGSLFSVHVPEVGLSGGFGFLLIASAVVFWKRGVTQDAQKLQQLEISRRLQARPVATAIGLGLLIGLMSGLFGAGGGMMILFALLLLGYSLHLAVGTSTMIMALTTASGTVGHALLGNMPYQVVLWTAAGTVLASFSSARLANKLNEQSLSKVMATIFAVLGVLLLVQL